MPGATYASAASGMGGGRPHSGRPRLRDPQIHIELRGAGEWIVSAHAQGQALHIYSLSPGDWLVSEVGKGSEGRGSSLGEALRALAAGARAPEWWQLIEPALEVQG